MSEQVKYTPEQAARYAEFMAREKAENEARAKALSDPKIVPIRRDASALGYTSKTIREPASGKEAPKSTTERKARSEAQVFDPRDPLPAARKLVEMCFTDAERNRLLHKHRGAFYLYNGAFYQQIANEAVRAKAWEFFGAASQPAKGGATPFKPTAARISDIMNALEAVCALDSNLDAPAWIGERRNHPPADEFMAVQNGLLHLPSGALYEPTPRFFGLCASEVKFIAGVGAPGWGAFLDQLWPDDLEHITALQDWFGYCLSGNTRLQKILFMVGPIRSGKGTIARVLKALLGAKSVASPTLASLSSNFGLASLIGKPLAIIPDARLSGRADQAVVVERLLSISGEDSLDIDRKHREAWTGTLPTRIMIVTNELLRAADASTALVKRLVVLKLLRSFYGNEDPGLTERLLTELPGILNWSLEGYRRLSERGYFIQPANAAEVVDDLESLASPTVAFADEKCEFGPHLHISAATLFDHWRLWCEANGHQPGTLQTFGRNLSAAYPDLVVRRPRQGDEKRPRIYEGIAIRHGSKGA